MAAITVLCTFLGEIMNPSFKTVSTLNPNAPEFVPTGLRSGLSSVGNNVSVSKNTGKKAHLERTDSTNSNGSDDERHRYWQAQLPDDITPDFDILSQAVNDRLQSHQAAAWDQDSNDMLDQLQRSNNLDRQAVIEENETGFLSDLVGERSFSEEIGEIDPIDLLVNEFPGFAAESLADIFTANAGDLGLTIEMLTQFELQEDSSPARHSQPQATSSPNLGTTDFPALAGSEFAHGLSQFDQDIDLQRPARPLQTVGADNFFTNRSFASGNSRAVTDFAAVVRKNAGVQWQYDQNGGVGYNFGPSRSPSQPLEGDSHARDSRATNGEKTEQSSSRRRSQSAPPNWLETGEAVSSMYEDLREEARDHARVRNAYFEQARQAYLVGNKALAKELSEKGQWHNVLMKNAHNKAGEAIYRHRNLSSGQIQDISQGQPQLLDLHGLHVNEAIPLLKRELAALRVAARSTQQRQQVFICVGTGHHTKGSRTPARLPVAVERYLAEDEHLHFTEQQPGMLRVVIP